jgi:hypothetical protein
MTRNATMLGSSEFSTRDFGGAMRFCGLRRRRCDEKVKISVNVFAICYRCRYGLASDDALLTTQYVRQ